MIHPEVKENPKETRVKVLLFLFFIVVFIAFFYWFGGFHFFFDKERLTGFLESLGFWGFVGFVVMQALQVVIPMVPAEATGFLGGFLYGPLFGTVLSIVGLTIGSVIAYQLAKSIGRPVVERMFGCKMLEKFDFMLHGKGKFMIFLFFLIPGFPKDAFCYVLGLGRLNFAEFISVTITGRLAGTIMLSYCGSFLRQDKYIELLVLVVIAATVLALAFKYKETIERRIKELQGKMGIHLWPR